MCAKEESGLTLIPNPLVEAGVSAVVNGVNTITGDFVDSSVDLVIPGPEPLILQRDYASSQYNTFALSNSWRHNHECWVDIDNLEFTEYDTPYGQGRFLELSGRGAAYSGKETVPDNRFLLKYDKAATGICPTNCCEGIITARNNLNNIKITTPKGIGSNTIEVLPPSGSELSFIEKSGPKSHSHHLAKEKKPNKHSLHYSYHSDGSLKKVRLTDHSDTMIFSGFFINSPVKKDKKTKDQVFSVVANDGRCVIYSLSRSHKKDFISEVQRPNAPTEKYEYANRLMTKKLRPDGRFTAIEYYLKDKEIVANTVVNLRGYKEGRVKLLKAPVGNDETPIVTHQFLYHSDRNIRHFATSVFNALNHKSKYLFSKEKRLTHIERYTGADNYQHYSTEEYVWGAEDTSEAGYLQAKYLKYANGQGYSARSLTYDEHGNVIKDTFYGNITGHSQPLAPSGRYPYENNCDRYSKTYKYGLGPVPHLMTEEREDNGKVTLYSYENGTDLVSSKLITDNGAIKIRNFFEYDHFGNLRKTIIDNGTTSDKADLTGVTERRITYTCPRATPPFGLPLQIDEMYMDISTKQEVLLKRVINDHSIEGYLKSQKVHDASGNLAYELIWDYDSHGNVKYESDALGQVITRKFDDNDNLIEEHNLAQNKIILFDYDFSNRPFRKEEIYSDGLRLTTTYQYDYLGNKTAVIDHFGNKTKYAYDEFNRVIGTTYPAIIHHNGELVSSSSSCEYDLGGNVVRAVDQHGDIMTATYNVYGKPVEIHYPDKSREYFEYNLDGTLKQSIAKNGTITKFHYDAFQREIQKDIYSSQQKLLSTTKSVYDSFHLKSTTNAAGEITYYDYDGAGRLISTKSSDRKTTYEYDSLGRNTITKEWYGDTSYRCKTQVLDLLNRVREENISEGETEQVLRSVAYDYDAYNNIIKKTTHSQAGTSITQTVFNGCKQPVKEIDAKGNTTQTFYNYAATNIYGQQVLETTKVDPLGNQTIITMSNLQKPGQVIRKNAFGVILSKKELFYSLIGDCNYTRETVITPKTERTPNYPERQIITVFLYDALHRLYDMTEALGKPEQKHTQIKYNSYGQKETIIKPNGVSIQHTYDAMGRLYTFSASDESFSYKYAYDLNGNPISVVDLKNNTETIRHYNEAGRLDWEQLGSGQKIAYEYDPLERPTMLTFSDSSKVKYIYDAMNLKEIQRFDKDGNLKYSHIYNAYDLSGNVIEAKFAGNAGTETVKYDFLGRVTEAAIADWNETIEYDAVGNLISATMKDAQAPVNSKYTYDDTYQLTSETGTATHQYVHDSLYNCVIQDGKTITINALNQFIRKWRIALAYDGNGNRIKKNDDITISTYEYDACDRLTDVIYNNLKWHYTYDSFNRRLMKQSFVKSNDEWQLSDQKTYLYQGQNEVGACNAEGKIVELRVLGIGKGAEIGSAVAFEFGDTVVAPVHDHNGNVVNLIDIVSGDTVERYRYGAFGEEKIYNENGAEIKTSALNNPWRFSSKRLDEETGFVNFGRRYYDPLTHRWTSPDPIGFEGGPNLYAYVLNSPLTHIDLYGLVGQGNSFFDSVSSTVRKIVKGISRAIGCLPLTNFAGNVIDICGKHLVPIPFVRDVVRMTGNFIAGNGLLWNTRDPKGTGSTGKCDYMNGRAAITVHKGILNSGDDTMQMAEKISQDANGQYVYGICNASNGFIMDLLECIAIKFNIQTISVMVATAQLKQLARTNNHILAIGHSQGGLILDRALKNLTVAERQKFEVLTVGSAKMIDEKGLGVASAENIVSWRDGVPFVVDTVGCFKGLCGEINVKFIDSSVFPLIDHNMSSDGYGNAIQGKVREFINENRIR